MLEMVIFDVSRSALSCAPEMSPPGFAMVKSTGLMSQVPVRPEGAVFDALRPDYPGATPSCICLTANTERGFC